MKAYYQEDNEQIEKTLIKMLEKDTGKTIFTMRIMEENSTGLEVLIVFVEKSVMIATIKIQEFDGKMAYRIQGNYI